MHLILAEINKYPKKESDVTQNSSVVPTKINFCGTAIAKKGNDRHSRRKSRDLIRLDLIRFDGSTRLESSRVYIFYNFNSTRLDSI